MASSPRANSESGDSQASTEQGPDFCLWDGPPEGDTVLVESNEVHLIPLGDQKCQHKLEVIAQDTLDSVSTARKRLTDDLIIFSSRAGVIFGRIPNSLSDDGFTQWLESFLEYISTSEKAAWWHTGHSGPWAGYVFVPSSTKKSKRIYSNTKNQETRPLKILGILDTYTENKPWVLQLPGWEDAESRAAILSGKLYVPRHQRRRRKRQKNPGKSNSTRVAFVWDPVEQSREVILRDEVWRDELMMERVEMSLI